MPQVGGARRELQIVGEEALVVSANGDLGVSHPSKVQANQVTAAGLRAFGRVRVDQAAGEIWKERAIVNGWNAAEFGVKDVLRRYRLHVQKAAASGFSLEHVAVLGGLEPRPIDRVGILPA